MDLMQFMQQCRNPKEQVMQMIQSMTQAQKNRLKESLPQVERIAKQLGIDADELNQIGAHL